MLTDTTELGYVESRVSNLIPRPYQIDGARWLHQTGRAILADDAGLGKTLQATLAAVKPVLITCPTYLVWQWAEFLESQYPDETIAVASGKAADRFEALTAGADWTIYNIEMLRRYPVPPLTQTLIVDEFHRLRGRKAQQTQFAAKIAQSIPRVYGLTATPIYRDIGDLWSQLHILNPTRWSSYWRFIDTYARTMDTGWATKIVGTKNDEQLIAELNQTLLRRTYREVGLFLPDIIDSQVVLDFTGPDRRAYDLIKDSLIDADGSEISASAALNELRRFTLPTKLTALNSLIEDAPGEPIIIFCWYRDSAHYIADALRCAPVTGDEPSERRREIALTAVANKKPVVLTIASLSEGIDLSQAKRIVFIEESYVPGEMHQAIRRVQRWTTDTRPVLSTYIRVRASADISVHRAQTTRQTSARAILKDALS